MKSLLKILAFIPLGIGLLLLLVVFSSEPHHLSGPQMARFTYDL